MNDNTQAILKAWKNLKYYIEKDTDINVDEFDKLLAAHEGESDELDYYAGGIMKYLNNNCHPHVEVTITPTNYELKEGIRGSGLVMDYVKD